VEVARANTISSASQLLLTKECRTCSSLWSKVPAQSQRPVPHRVRKQTRLEVERLEDRLALSADVVGPPPVPPTGGTPPPLIAPVSTFNVAENQNLTVASSGGLLHNLPAATGGQLSITQLLVNGLIVSPGQTGVTQSGAQLTVGSDGSFSYSPAVDFVGAESVVFVAVAGAQVESGAATFSVGLPDPTLPPTTISTTATSVAYDVAVNMGLKATAGVGLLNDLSNPANHLYNVAFALVNGVAAMPGQPVPTASGGLLTVASDGSFTYQPAAGFVGAESVSFVAAQGGQLEAGTATLSVGVPVAVAQNAIAFTSAGSLEYTSADQDKQVAVEEVPYAIDATTPAVLFAVFSTRLPDVNVQQNVRLPGEVAPVVVKSKLSNFTFAGGLDLMKQIAAVRVELFSALGALNAEAPGIPCGNWGGPSAGVLRWFLGSGEDSSTFGPAQYQALIGVYQDVADGLDNQRTWYYDDTQMEGYFGYVSGIPDDYDVRIGTPYWAGTDMDRFGTVIHELTHLYAGTADNGYFNNPGALSNQAIVYKDPDSGEVVQLNTSKLLFNADTYAGYLTQYYYWY
jgi:hypothetical protein